MTLRTSIEDELKKQGHSKVEGKDIVAEIDANGNRHDLAKEWNDLESDRYLKNGARFRERRYGRFYFFPESATVKLLKHRPYYQSTKANSYAGGVQRVVERLSGSTLSNPLLEQLVSFDFNCFPVGGVERRQPWQVDCHQFRIIGAANEAGEPTPEGVHRDEIDFGAIHLMSRHNATGGHSYIYDNEKSLKSEFCLAELMDTMYWADQDVMHSASPVAPADHHEPAYRDILILGYTRKPELSPSD